MVNEKILDIAEYKGSKVEIVEMTKLEGSSSPEMSRAMFYMERANASMKFIRVTLNGETSLKTESGALYYTVGDIKSTLQTGGVGGMITKAIKGAVAKEKAFNPEYSGIGKVILEPTWKHFIKVELKNDTIIVDKGCYYCSIGDITTDVKMQSNISSAAFGGEGLFQTKISGTGIVILEIPVPMSEIEIINLKDETVQVDGNFAILRTSGINFSVTKSSKKITGTILSGEGLLNKFEGTGMVWLAPTAPFYNKMLFGFNAFDSQKNMNNKQ